MGCISGLGLLGRRYTSGTSRRFFAFYGGHKHVVLDNKQKCAKREIINKDPLETSGQDRCEAQRQDPAKRGAG